MKAPNQEPNVKVTWGILIVLVVLITLGFFQMTAASASECTPQDAYTEVILGTPAVDAVYEEVVVSERTRTDYIYTGEWTDNDAPIYPGSNWSLYTGEPVNVRFHDSGHFFQPLDQEGNGTWFYIVVGHPVIEQHLVSEAIPAGGDTVINHEAVVCEIASPVVETEHVEVIPADTIEIQTVMPEESQAVEEVEESPNVAVESTSYPELAYTGLNNWQKVFLGGIAGCLIVIGISIIRLARR